MLATATFVGCDVRLTSWSDDEKVALVFVAHDREPGRCDSAENDGLAQVAEPGSGESLHDGSGGQSRHGHDWGRGSGSPSRDRHRVRAHRDHEALAGRALDLDDRSLLRWLAGQGRREAGIAVGIREPPRAVRRDVHPGIAGRDPARDRTTDPATTAEAAGQAEASAAAALATKVPDLTGIESSTTSECHARMVRDPVVQVVFVEIGVHPLAPFEHFLVILRSRQGRQRGRQPVPDRP